jgi:S-adenosylmethionine decarboxylase
MVFQSVRPNLSKIIERNGLTGLGSVDYNFEGGGYTVVIALAESHMTIHTWPEYKFFDIDVFTCNVTSDNTEATLRVFDEILDLFPVKKVNNKFFFR